MLDAIEQQQLVSSTDFRGVRCLLLSGQGPGERQKQPLSSHCCSYRTKRTHCKSQVKRKLKDKVCIPHSWLIWFSRSTSALAQLVFQGRVSATGFPDARGDVQWVCLACGVSFVLALTFPSPLWGRGGSSELGVCVCGELAFLQLGFVLIKLICALFAIATLYISLYIL